MNKKLRAFLWVALFIGLLIVVVQHLKDNPEWRGFSGREFLNGLAHVHPTYLLIAIVLHLSSYVFRALRWSEFLRPVKRTSLGNLLSAVIIGFTAVNLLGRAGEFSRPVFLSRKENLPLSVTLATVVVERLFDFSAIMMIFLVNLLFFQLADNTSHQSRVTFELFSRGAAFSLAMMLCVTAALFLFRMNALRWVDFLITRVRLVPNRFKVRWEGLLKSFLDGLAFIHHPRALVLSMFYSAALWLVITTSVFFVIRSFGTRLSYSQAIVVITFAALGAIIQLPGVGGGLQALTLFALVSFLGVSAEKASGITLLAWAVGSFPVVIIGLADLLREGMSLRALKHAAEEDVDRAFVDPSTRG